VSVKPELTTARSNYILRQRLVLLYRRYLRQSLFPSLSLSRNTSIKQHRRDFVKIGKTSDTLITEQREARLIQRSEITRARGWPIKATAIVAHFKIVWPSFKRTRPRLVSFSSPPPRPTLPADSRPGAPHAPSPGRRAKCAPLRLARLSLSRRRLAPHTRTYAHVRALRAASLLRIGQCARRAAAPRDNEIQSR
jgi:hypothetical protein